MKFRNPPSRALSQLRSPHLRVLIVEPQHLVRRGLRHLLESQREVDVVSAVNTGAEGLTATRAVQFDVAVVGVRLPDGDGVELARRLRAGNSEIKIVMLAKLADRAAVLRSISAGVHGFVSVDAEEKDLASTVVQVARGKKLLDPRLADGLGAEWHLKPKLDQLRSLTRQERMVLELLAEGLPDSEIAERAHLTENAVGTYVSLVLLKLGVRDRIEAVEYAVAHDLVSNVT